MRGTPCMHILLYVHAVSVPFSSGIQKQKFDGFVLQSGLFFVIPSQRCVSFAMILQ